jgi:hypothetical protein
MKFLLHLRSQLQRNKRAGKMCRKNKIDGESTENIQMQFFIGNDAGT